MKVVLFCGGRGFAVPGQRDVAPKPMTMVGYRPILWHVMRFYADHGLKEFVVCLGARGEVIKDYFLDYSEALSNDFVLSQGGRQIDLLRRDIDDWDITFVDTGARSPIGERLRRVREHVGDELFCANYGDTLTDAPILDHLEDFRNRSEVAAMLSVRPRYSFHVVAHEPDGLVSGIEDLETANLWVNGGYFLFRPEIFDHLRRDEDLLDETFGRLVARRELVSYRYEGFWSGLDTLRDLHELEMLHDSGDPPWALRNPGALAAGE